MIDKERQRLTRRGRKWIYGIALAVLPILTTYGILTEEQAVLYATLLGSILVPGLALHDNSRAERDQLASYEQGLDEGWQAATNTERDSPRGENGL